MAVRKKFEVEGQEEAGIRINKYLADSGVCSRREADRYVAEGKVAVDGVTAQTGVRVFPGQRVTLLGKEIRRQEKQVLIAFYKPVGVVCTTDPREPDNIIDYLNYGERIYPIGRLDKDSEGLLLLTNDGDIVNRILRAGNHHEKEYLVTVNRDLTPEFLKGMASGVPVLDTVTKPCQIEQTGRNSFRIILTQGLNRQVRRMCEYFGYRVLALKRVRIMQITLGRLKPGTYRNLTPQELEQLRLELKDSSPLPAAQRPKPTQRAEQTRRRELKDSSPLPAAQRPKPTQRAEQMRRRAEAGTKRGPQDAGETARRPQEGRRKEGKYGGKR